MEIGLGLTGLQFPLDPGDLPPPPPGGLAPLPGYLDAANIVFIGASISGDAFGDYDTGTETPSLRVHRQDYATAAGITAPLISYAVSGATVGAALNQVNRAKADLAATEGQNVYVLHVGGNNVSQNRPWPGGQAEFEADYDALIAAITAGGDRVIPLPLTKRLYNGTANDVIQGDAASEANGSKPYNDNIILPRIAAHAPDWIVDGTPWIDPYDYVDRNPQSLFGDGIHGPSHDFARYVISRLGARAAGDAGLTSRAGRSYLVDFQWNDPKFNGEVLTDPRNVVDMTNDPDNNRPYFHGITDAAGVYDRNLFLAFTGDGLQSSSYTYDAVNSTKLAEPLFRQAGMLDTPLRFNGTAVLDARIDGLVPGDTLVVKCAGAYSANPRMLDMTLSGTGLAPQTVTLDNRGAASTHQAESAPVIIPDDGTVHLAFRRNSAATNGYLAALVLDFS